jgi:hypothetical protein
LNLKQTLNYIHQNKEKFKQFDPHEFALGIQVEFEHTDNPAESAKIATDHLGETDNYYSKLVKDGLVDEPLKYTQAIERLLMIKEMQKAKNFAKLIKKVIINKRGIQQTIYEYKKI